MPDLPSESWLDLLLLSCWVIGLTCAGWFGWKGIKGIKRIKRIKRMFND